MQDSTRLLRQVHPHWFKDGHIISLAFRPTPKDQGLLSVYDGDQISQRGAWEHYTGTLGLASAGVWMVTVAEAASCELPTRNDPLENFAAHAVIDFTSHAKKQQEAKSKLLATIAEERGCLYSPSQ